MALNSMALDVNVNVNVNVNVIALNSMALDGTRWHSMAVHRTPWHSVALHRTQSQLMGGATHLPSSACAAARRTYALRTGGGGGRCLMSLSRNVAISITRELMREAIR